MSSGGSNNKGKNIMLDANSIINKRFTLGWLFQQSGSDLSDHLLHWDMHRKLYPESFKSGRANYIWLQLLLCSASGDLWAYGGQGKKNPDFSMKDARCETKAFDLADMHKPKHLVDVAASAFFAKNCKVTEHRKLLSESSQKAKEFLFKHSYDGNDYYLLSSTRNLSCSLQDVVLYFVETDLLTSCLDPSSHYKRVDMNRLDELVTVIS